MSDDLIQFEGGFLACDMLGEASITDRSELTQYAIEDGSIISDHCIRAPRTLSLTLVQTETPISETTGFARALQALSYQARPLGSASQTVPYQARPDGKQTATVPVRQSEFRPAPLMALSAGIQSLLFGGGPAKELSLTGLKSDQALESKAIKLAGLAADGALTTKEIKVHVLAAGAPVDRVNLFHVNLLSLLETATPVIVTVKGASYIDLVLTSVTRTDAGGQVGRASFAVELQQIATVETKTVDLPPVPKSKAPKQAGPKPPTETKEEQKAKLRSILLGGSIGAGAQSE